MTKKPLAKLLQMMKTSVSNNVPLLRRISGAQKVVAYAVTCPTLDTKLKHRQEHLQLLPRQVEHQLQPLSPEHQQERQLKRQQSHQQSHQQQNLRCSLRKFHPFLPRLHHLVNQRIFLPRFHRRRPVCHPVENQRISLHYHHPVHQVSRHQ